MLSLPIAVKPIGRLDKDSEGLLLLTDCGDLNYAVCSPGVVGKEVTNCVVHSLVVVVSAGVSVCCSCVCVCVCVCFVFLFCVLFLRVCVFAVCYAFSTQLVSFLCLSLLSNSRTLSINPFLFFPSVWFTDHQYVCTFPIMKSSDAGATCDENDMRIHKLTDGQYLKDGFARALSAHARVVPRMPSEMPIDPSTQSATARKAKRHRKSRSKNAAGTWEVTVTVDSGRNRIVRRLMAAAGFTRLSSLQRTRIGPLSLSSPQDVCVCVCVCMCVRLNSSPT
jgi:hypothetical protein